MIPPKHENIQKFPTFQRKGSCTYGFAESLAVRNDSGSVGGQMYVADANITPIDNGIPTKTSQR
ncbi:hypothetical protein ABIB34_004399 [Rhodococcus sp. UYP5]